MSIWLIILAVALVAPFVGLLGLLIYTQYIAPGRKDPGGAD